jgi:hypothetical protein
MNNNIDYQASVKASAKDYYALDFESTEVY